MGKSGKSKLKPVKVGQNVWIDPAMRPEHCQLLIFDSSNSQKLNFAALIRKTLKLCGSYLPFSLF